MLLFKVAALWDRPGIEGKAADKNKPILYTRIRRRRRRGRPRWLDGFWRTQRSRFLSFIIWDVYFAWVLSHDNGRFIFNRTISRGATSFLVWENFFRTFCTVLFTWTIMLRKEQLPGWLLVFITNSSIVGSQYFLWKGLIFKEDSFNGIVQEFRSYDQLDQPPMYIQLISM